MHFKPSHVHIASSVMTRAFVLLIVTNSRSVAMLACCSSLKKVGGILLVVLIFNYRFQDLHLIVKKMHMNSLTDHQVAIFWCNSFVQRGPRHCIRAAKVTSYINFKLQNAISLLFFQHQLLPSDHDCYSPSHFIASNLLSLLWKLERKIYFDDRITPSEKVIDMLQIVRVH